MPKSKEHWKKKNLAELLSARPYLLMNSRNFYILKGSDSLQINPGLTGYPWDFPRLPTPRTGSLTQTVSSGLTKNLCVTWRWFLLYVVLRAHWSSNGPGNANHANHPRADDVQWRDGAAVRMARGPTTWKTSFKDQMSPSWVKLGLCVSFKA